MAQVKQYRSRLALIKKSNRVLLPMPWNSLGLPPLLCFLLFFFVPSLQAKGLPDILLQVEQNTPALQASHARTKARQAALRREKSGYFGEIDALVKSSNYNDARLINPITFPVNMQADLFDDHQVGYGVTGRLPLDINGRIMARVKAADKELTAALAQEGNVRLQVLHTAADFYHNLEGLKALEQALEKQIEALTAHIRVVAAAIAAGRVAPVEKLRLVADQEAVKGKLATLQGNEQGIRARLAALMGAVSFFDPVAPVVNKPVALSAQEEKISNRPDIQAVTSSGEAADSRVRAAIATRLPALNLDGSWIQNQGFNGEGDDTWALFATLQLPLWDGGGRRAAVEEARSNRQVLRHQLAALRNQARAEVVAAQAARKAARISYQASIASIKAARETERIQSDRFAEGRLSAADLVDTEAALAAARSSSAVALASWWQAGDHLRRALGLEPSQYRKSASSSGQKH